MFSYRADSGIGRATAERFASEGGQVVVIDWDEKSGQKTVDIITKNNGIAIFSQVTVRQNETPTCKTLQIIIHSYQLF